jgi:hypothetical protein
MLSKATKGAVAVSAAAATKYVKQQSEPTTTDAKPISPPTKYFQIIDETLKEKSPELRKKLYTDSNPIIRYGKQFAVERGLINDDNVVSSLEGAEKKAANETFGLMRQLSESSPGLGEKAARTSATMAANVYNTSKYLEGIQSPVAKNLKSEFDGAFGGKKSRKKSRKKRTKKNKRRKHKKTRKNRL